MNFFYLNSLLHLNVSKSGNSERAIKSQSGKVKRAKQVRAHRTNEPNEIMNALICGEA